MNGTDPIVNGQTTKVKKHRKSVRQKSKPAKLTTEPCAECASNGVQVRRLIPDLPPNAPCQCLKCQPPKLMEGPDCPISPQPVIISAEGDSSTSRSTLKGRARSWPLLVQPDVGKDPREPHLGQPSPVAQVRRLLWRHYYPEGGWGYMVVNCSVLVQILNHGLQLSYGVLLPYICQKFNAGIFETGE